MTPKKKLKIKNDTTFRNKDISLQPNSLSNNQYLKYESFVGMQAYLGPTEPVERVGQLPYNFLEDLM